MSGIIQATNLQVDNIKHSGGTSAITIENTGKVNTTQSGYEEKTASQLNNGSWIVSNSISTLARRITLITNELVTSASAAIFWRVGNGGDTLSTSIYEYLEWYTGHNANKLVTDYKSGTTEMGFNSWASTSNSMNHHIEFFRIGNNWIVSLRCFSSTGAYEIGGQGRIHNVGNIDTLQLFPASSTFASGDAAVYWE